MHSEARYALAFLLAGVFVALAYIEASVDRVRYAIVYELFKIYEGIGQRRSRTVSIAL